MVVEVEVVVEVVVVETPLKSADFDSTRPFSNPTIPNTYGVLPPSLSTTPLLLFSQISYYSPVDPSLFGLFALTLLGSGLGFMAIFFM